MAFTKEDYMRLPKERLADMLVERDNEAKHIEFVPNTTPEPIYPSIRPYYPWWDVKYAVTCEN